MTSSNTLFVLIACEESQAECMAFRSLGHVAFSCDIQPCRPSGHPEWHIQGDVSPLLYGFPEFTTMDERHHGGVTATELSQPWPLPSLTNGALLSSEKRRYSSTAVGFPNPFDLCHTLTASYGLFSSYMRTCARAGVMTSAKSPSCFYPA